MTTTVIPMYSTVTFAAILVLASAVLLMRHRRQNAVLAAALPSPAEPAVVVRRLVAINGADVPSAASVRSIARQAAPYHTRPIQQSMAPNAFVPSTALPPMLAARRPGLPKSSLRIERRVVVLR